MKLIKLEIKNDCLLEITCKRPSIFKSYLEEVGKIEDNLKSKDLGFKYLGWSIDINGNIVFTFRLLDFEKDIKPYIERNR